MSTEVDTNVVAIWRTFRAYICKAPGATLGRNLAIKAWTTVLTGLGSALLSTVRTTFAADNKEKDLDKTKKN